MMRFHRSLSIGVIGVLFAALILGCAGASDSGQDAVAADEQKAETNFMISSPNFTEIRPKKRIPVNNTCYGENWSPPLQWTDSPSETKSFAIVADDVDHMAGSWALWVIYGIPAQVTELAEGISSSTSVLPDGTVQGINDFGVPGYTGPCPPPIIKTYAADWTDIKPRVYSFTIYALDTELSLSPGSSKSELISAMDGHILAESTAKGKYMTPQSLSTKGGAGFLSTSQDKDKQLVEPGCGSKALTKQRKTADCKDSWKPPEATAVIEGEKIYNSTVALVTATPATCK